MYTLGSVRLQRLKTQGTQSSRPHNAKKGISPVIATIILIAITIVIAIAVAGWVFGLFGSYSRTQAVTIVASASSCNPNGCNIMVSNQGGSAITVVSASVDGQTVPTNSITGGTVIPAGKSNTVSITFPSGTSFTAGQTVQVQLGLSNGNTLSTTLVVNS